MRIAVTSVMVDDQSKTLAFYTEKLGFVKQVDIPMGEFRWLTVVSPEGSAEIELLLEPNHHPAAKVFQKALYDDGIPATAFASADVRAEYERLKGLGVVFRSEPKAAGDTWLATFDDTCGNLIQLFEAVAAS
jgi:catechol 2,3-dioxygenase-like lactoylglutathione lyase family enzyme